MPAAQEAGSAANSAMSLNYQSIIEQEQLYDQMSLDNYAILLHLIHQGESDIRQVFLNHQRHRDVIVLNLELNTRTEDALHEYLRKWLKKDEVKKVEKLRQAKSQEYLQIFRKFIPGMMGERQLMEQLRRLVRDGTGAQAAGSKTSELLVDQNSEQDSSGTPEVMDRKERMSYLLYQYLQARANVPDRAAREQLLREQLDAESPMLIGILESEANGPLTKQALDRIVLRLDEFIVSALQRFDAAQLERQIAGMGG